MENNQEVLERLTHIEDKTEKFNGNVELIIHAITGNPLTMDGGMVQDLRETRDEMRTIKTRLDSLELFRNKFTWTFIIVSVSCAFIGGVLGLLIAYLTLIKKP